MIFLELFPAVRYIHAKKRGMPLPSGLGLLSYKLLLFLKSFNP